MKYRDWLAEWMNSHVLPNLKPLTAAKYGQIVRIHIAPELGEYELSELSPLILQGFIARKTAAGLAPNTVRGILSVLQNSLVRAVAFDLVGQHYASAVVRPRARERKIQCLTKLEQRRVEQFVIESDNDSLFGVVLCMYTGLRIGELLALTWNDVDLSRRTITVSKTCRDEWRSGKYVKVTDAPKTRCSERIVPIPKQLIAHLREIKAAKHGTYVVPGRSDYGAEIRSYQRSFSGLLKRLHIRHIGFHALRHTFATRAIEVGMDVKTLAEILGHKNPTVTLTRYAHSLTEHKTDMMNKVGKIFVLSGEFNVPVKV